VRLVICGTGPLREALDAQVREAGLADRVTFTGLVPNDIVARYAAVADLFVLPSLLEALPTVAVEALASGTPVISADHPGGRELHELFGDDLRLVPRNAPDRLAEALVDALTKPRRATAATLGLVEARFGAAAIHAAFSGVYRTVVDQSPPA
jgi:glycosyltransferase involved in cell wall biosynthesis